MNIQFLIALHLSALTPLNVTEPEYDLRGYTHFYADETAELAASDVKERLDAFKPLPSGSANFGLHPAPLWLALKLVSTESTDTRVLSFSYPHLDNVDLYIYDETGALIRTKSGGDRTPFYNRYHPHRTINFGVDFSESTTQLWLIRVRTESSLQVGMQLQTLKSFSSSAASENAGNFLYYGIILVMIVLNVFWFISLRDRLYLPYIAYVTFYLVAQMSLNGTFFQFIAPANPGLANTTVLTSLALAMGFGIKFCIEFNELERTSPRFAKLLTFLYLLNLLVAACSTFIPYRLAVLPILVSALASPLIALCSGFVAVKAGNNSAKYFLLAWISFLVGTTLFALKTLGALPSVFVTEYGMQIGSALEVILLTLALSDRVRSIIEDRDALTQRVSRQTAILADETQKRAKAEQDLRESLQERILLINDASHHLNNPLNHIMQANEIVMKVEAPLRAQLRELLSSAGSEADEVRSYFESALDKLQSSSLTIEQAIDRSSATIELLGHLAQHHEKQVETFELEAISQFLKRRGASLRLIEKRSRQSKLIGYPILPAFALETVARNFNQSTPNLELQVKSSETLQETELSFPPEHLISNGKVEDSIQAARLLLKGIGAVDYSSAEKQVTVRLKEA